MSSEDIPNKGEAEDICVVCCKNVEVYAIGSCDHPVCYECSTRMRVLCKQNECPICRQDLPKVIFTQEVEQFSKLSRLMERNFLPDRNLGIVFATSSIQKKYYHLLEHTCFLCEKNNHFSFRNFFELKEHMRKVHELFYCELCVDNLKIFSTERRCYTRQELGLHRRKGDFDNKSHRGHPLCEFCDTRYMDNDDLFRHLRRDHFYCHFCDADGKHQYYNSYSDLRAHFFQDHYLCEEGNCRNEQFTSVFRTEIDLKAHQAGIHSKDLGKSGTKQARTLEVAFTLTPRPNGSQNRRQQNRNRIEEEIGAVGYDNYNVEPGGYRENNQKQIDPMNAAEFPQLSGVAVGQSRAPPTVTFGKFNPKQFSGEDFPSLGCLSGHPRSSNVTITTHSKVVQKGSTQARASDVTITTGATKNQQNFAIHTNNFPSRSGSAAQPSNSTVRFSISNGNGKNRPESSRSNLSIQVRNPANVAITTRINTAPTSTTIQVRPKVSDFPALSNEPIPQVQWVQQKPKHQDQKSTSPKVNPTPTLPPTSLDFPVLSKKKRSSVTVPVSNSWVNLNSFNSENRNTVSSTDPDLEWETHGKKDKKGRKDQKQQKRTEKDVKKTKKVYESNGATVDNNNFDIGANGVNVDKSKNGIVKKLSELKIDTFAGNTNDVYNLPQKPPPGFNVVKPPPGFSNVIHCNKLLTSDLTFTNSSGESFPILPTTSYHEYIQPQNFQKRNEALVRNFNQAIVNREVLRELKNFSALYRQGKYPADKYYALCRDVLGSEFEQLFPELLVLLPDIDKQQQLYRIHVGNSAKENLAVCLTCNQVLCPRDLRLHLSKHALESNFPVLPQPGNTTPNCWKK